MKCCKGFHAFIVIMMFLVIISCGQLPKDNYPNPALHGYHRMEFDITKAGATRKEIGIGNIYLKENQDLSGVSFKIYGLYKGILHMKSDACGINISTRFEGISTFKLDDLIPNPAKCSIRISAETDKINKREHVIVESGIIKLNIIGEDTKPISFEYTRTNSSIKSKTYSYIGQGSIQRQEGDLTSFEKFEIKTDLTQGGRYRVSGCGYVITDQFAKDNFEVSFKELYSKNYLNREDTCDFEVIILPNEVVESYLGRFSVNIFSREVVKLEALEWEIKKKWGKEKLYARGGEHILGCMINDLVETKKGISWVKCKVKYDASITYWIRSLTTNGRKSVFALKNGTVIWEE